VIKAVIFDFGGVIAEEGFRQGLFDIANANGKDSEFIFNSAVDLIHKPNGYVVGKASEASWWNELRVLTGIAGSDSKLREIILGRFVVRPEMMKIVNSLKSKGYIVSILSDQTNWLDELDSRNPFSHAFRYVFNSYYIHKSKRDHTVFRDACGTIGVRPEEVLFIDDNEDNTERAREEGLNTICFRDIDSFRSELKMSISGPVPDNALFDCIIVGASPGGLQAAIYLGRYNRQVLLIDRGGGRTRHAAHIENYFGHRRISGLEIITLGLEQARSFNVRILEGAVSNIRKKQEFEVAAEDSIYRSKNLIVATGGRDNIPEVANVSRFFAESFFTCLDCDGYRATGKKLVILGNSIQSVRLAFAMKQIYTKDIGLILSSYEPPESYVEELKSEGIRLISGRPVRIIGKDRMESIELADGRSIDCEVIMSNFDLTLNDEFLSGLNLKKDSSGIRYVTDRNYESSVKGLFILGPLTGHDQVAIAVGEGAISAIEINGRLLDL